MIRHTNITKKQTIRMAEAIANAALCACATTSTSNANFRTHTRAAPIEAALDGKLPEFWFLPELVDRTLITGPSRRWQ